MSDASIASPSPVTEIGPDELTLTWRPAVALIPAPSPVTEMAPEEVTATLASLKTRMPVPPPPLAREMPLDDVRFTSPPAKEDRLIPLPERPLIEMFPEVVAVTAPAL